MRQLKYLAMAVLAVSLAACEGSDKLTPTAKRLNGPLGQFFEVVERDYKMSEGNKLSVEFKRIAEGGPTDASWSSRPTFTVELLDEDGNSIASGNTDVVRTEDQLESVFSLGVNESASITFDFDEDNSKNAIKFKVTSKWDESADNKPVGNEVKSSDEKESDEAIETSDATSSFGLGNVLLPSQLKGKVEVINAEKSVDSYGFPSMEITFKLLSTVNTSSMCSEYGQMWIVGVGQTENGVDVKELLPFYREWRTDDSDGKEFKEFLESEPDETITLEFSGSKESSNDVKSDLEKVKKFKLKITN